MEGKDDIKREDWIKAFFQDFETEEPSVDFKNTVMDKVLQDWVNESVIAPGMFSKTNKWLMILGGIVVVALVFIVDMAGVRELYMSYFNIEPENMPDWNKVVNMSFGWMKYIPVTIYYILIGVAVIFAFDRLLNRVFRNGTVTG